MIFLHGGVVCPAELAALVASMPFALALFHWLRCRVSTWWRNWRNRRKPRSSNPWCPPGGRSLRYPWTHRIRIHTRKRT